MKTPILAVVIVAHNQEAYLVATLGSLKKQSLGIAQMQVILVDDSSTDKTQLLFEDFRKQYPDNVSVYSVSYRNVGQTRNAALKQVTAPYLMFLDGDDLLTDDACALLLEGMQSTGAAISISPLARFFNEPEQIEKNQPDIELLTSRELLEKLLLHQDYMGHLIGTCMQSDLFLNLIFPEFSAYEDVYVVPDLIQRANCIASLNRSVYHYRQRKNSTSSSIDDEKAGCMLAVLEKLAQFADSSAMRKAYQAMCVKQCCILLDNVKNLSPVHKKRMSKLIQAIPFWAFILAPDVRTSRKRLFFQIRRQLL